MKILALTMYSGEKEYERCLGMISTQINIDVEIYKIENRPNHEAHSTLYGKIDEFRDEFDVFAKIDADMVLGKESALDVMSRMFRSHADLDHLTIPVDDVHSGRRISGMHLFSPRAEWPEIKDRTFVDPSPSIPGKRVVWRNAPTYLVRHMPDPWPWQAFFFGYHRAIKARLLWERRLYRYSLIQLGILTGALERWRNGASPNAFEICLGASYGFASHQSEVSSKGALSPVSEAYQASTQLDQYTRLSHIEANLTPYLRWKAPFAEILYGLQSLRSRPGYLPQFNASD